MKKALTALMIANLKPTGVAYYIGDAKQDGLRVRVAPNGTLTWNVTVRVKHGSLLSTSLGRCDHEGKNGLDLSGARTRASEIVKAARLGVNLVANEQAVRSERENRIRVQDLIDQYGSDITNPNRKGGALRTAPEIQRRLRRALEAKLLVPASELRRFDIARTLDVAAASFPREAEKRRQLIDSMYRWAVTKGYVEINPAQGLPSYGSGAPRDRVLTDEEIKALWHWLDGGAERMPTDAIHVLRLQLLTGARVGEIAGLTSSELWTDASRLFWTLPADRSKNKKAHTRPLIGRARTLVDESLQRTPSGPFFRIQDKSRALRSDDIGRALNNRKLPADHFTTHDLRRTFVSRLDELGVSLDAIAAAIGHRRGGIETRTLVRHYSRPNLDLRIEHAMDVWEKHIDTLLRS